MPLLLALLCSFSFGVPRPQYVKFAVKYVIWIMFKEYLEHFPLSPSLCGVLRCLVFSCFFFKYSTVERTKCAKPALSYLEFLVNSMHACEDLGFSTQHGA